jgi:hypothetical protein
MLNCVVGSLTCPRMGISTNHVAYTRPVVARAEMHWWIDQMEMINWKATRTQLPCRSTIGQPKVLSGLTAYGCKSIQLVGSYCGK